MSKVYAVGGSVRDELMGSVPNDLDYVVTGSSSKEMLDKGFRAVGASFPVFLCPETGDEYALARTESSTGERYQDFDCYFGKDVTIEDDLLRRDLTINAVAKDLETGELVDPYGGIKDIKNKVLHPVSECFKEDAVRVLRAARFNARSPDFKYSNLLQEYCDQMYVNSDLDFLTPERVWKEMEKALTTEKPSIFFEKLKRYRLFGDLNKLWGTPQKPEHHPEIDTFLHTMLVIDYAAKEYGDPEIVFSGLMHDLGKAPCYKEFKSAHGHETRGLPFVESFCEKWKVPNNYRDLALLVCEHHTKIHGMFGRNNQGWTRPKSIMVLFKDTNALAKPERFEKILKSCVADARGRGATPEQIKEFENKPYHQKEYLLECLDAAKSVDTKEISGRILAEGKKDGIFIGEQIRIARIDAIRTVQNKWKNKEKL